MQKQYGILLSYAIVLFLLSMFNLLMTGFNYWLWILHVCMSLTAFGYCHLLRMEENLLLKASEPKFDPIDA